VTVCLALSGALAPTVARAEGLAQVGVGQDLEDDTVMYVDILSASERITWTGPRRSAIRLYRPNGTLQGTYSTGTSITPDAGVGTYMVTISGASGATLSSWDVAVSGATSGRGRLWSYDWHFNAGSFA
jgi:hypothetical protein